MSEIVRHDYNGFLIRQRKSDGYTCLTDMAKATNRKVAKYFELKSTTAYLEGLSVDVRIRTSELVEISKGGSQVNDQGTWAHPEIAIDFAKWCNVPFRIWANRALRLLIEKKEIQAEVESQPLQLPPADVRLKECANAFRDLQELVGIDFNNPRVQQYYQDVVNNIVLDSQRQKQLSPGKERWMGIVEFAETLGYKVMPKKAGTLGKRAKAWFVETTGKAPYEERRFVNGRMCPVKLYNITECGDGLTQVIKGYLGETGGLVA